MTLYGERTVKCMVCDAESSHLGYDSIHIRRPQDLDLDMRHTGQGSVSMSLSIQECPTCGYCAPDLSLGPETAADVIRSTEYQEQLKSPEFPHLANVFLCHSLIQERENNFAVAAIKAIYAAWVCDDASHQEGAKKCRLRAIRMYDKAKAKLQTLTSIMERHDYGFDYAFLVTVTRTSIKAIYDDAVLITDLLRRAGEFELAMVSCKKGLELQPEKDIRTLLEFQQVLIERKDIDKHTMEEAGMYFRIRALGLDDT